MRRRLVSAGLVVVVAVGVLVGAGIYVTDHSTGGPTDGTASDRNDANAPNDTTGWESRTGEPIRLNGPGGTVFEPLDAARTEHRATYVVGMSKANRGLRAVVMRRTPDGGREWASLTRGDNESRRAVAVATAPDGGALVYQVAQTFARSSEPRGILVRYDADGDVRWEERIGTVAPSYHPHSGAVHGHEDGWIVAVGDDANRSATRLMGIARGGDVEWERRQPLGYPVGIESTESGYVLTGVNDLGTGVLAVTDGGRFRYARTFGNGSAFENEPIGESRAVGAVPTEDGDVLVAGFREFSEIGGGVDPWVARFDPETGVEWSRTYGSIPNEVTTAVRPLDGGIALAGFQQDTVIGTSRWRPDGGWIVGVDANGSQRFFRTTDTAGPVGLLSGPESRFRVVGALATQSGLDPAVVEHVDRGPADPRELSPKTVSIPVRRCDRGRTSCSGPMARGLTDCGPWGRRGGIPFGHCRGTSDT